MPATLATDLGPTVSSAAPTEAPSPSLPTTVADRSQVLQSGIRIEEHSLVQRPYIEPLAFMGLDGQNEVQLLRRHASQLHQRLRPESYYSLCGCSLWLMQGNDRFEAADEETGRAAVKRNGVIVFSLPNNGPGVTSPYRVLAGYDDHWVVELAQRVQNADGSTYFSGRVFIDGRSVNEEFGYQETFGFQTIAGRPFYFYKQDGQIGVVADGQQVPLGYEEVPHYGCCSASALNPRIARNMLAFFARRADRWQYIEIGAFEEDR